MSRHRNIRKLDYSEECGYDDVYGRSLEDEVAVSPSTAARFMYQRESRDNPSLNSFLEQREDAIAGSRQDEKPPSAKSPLATSSCSGIRTAGIAPPPGFAPIGRNMEKGPPSQGPPPGFAPIGRSIVKGPPSQAPPPGFALIGRSMEKGPPSQGKGSSKGSTKKVSSMSAVPKFGFNPSFLTTGGHFNDTHSPSLSPCRSPARTPSPPAVPRIATPKLGVSATKSKQPKIDLLAEYQEQERSNKEKINLVVIGHVDAGKSTLMGHLLYLVGAVSKKLMHKYEQESQKRGKGSFAYAWVLDETGEERHRGITMDVALQVFETSSKVINLLDAPGHRDFIPNMIMGAAQADVAVLVVNATVGEFEAGFESGGQTREHAMLVRSLGVKQLAVAINKMDTVGWSKVRFDEILQKLKTFLKQAGFKEADISYVPCSGLSGDNLTKVSTVQDFVKWYSGPTLLQTIDQFTSPSRPVSIPFRCCIGDIFKGHGAGVYVAGKVNSGYVQVGENVYVLPAQEVAYIKSMSMNDEVVSLAAAGDQIVFNISGVDISKISLGGIICCLQQPVKVATLFEARIIIFNIDIPITTGYSAVLHYQMLSEPAVITKLLSLLNKTTGELIKKKPRCITKNSVAVVRIQVLRPVCLELYAENKELGRLMLRSSGHTIAAGVVTKIL